MEETPEHLKYHLETIRARIEQIKGSDNNIREWMDLEVEKRRVVKRLRDDAMIPVYAKYEHDRLISLYLVSESQKVRDFVIEGGGSFVNVYGVRGFITTYSRGQGFKVVRWIGNFPTNGEWPDEYPPATDLDSPESN